MTADSWRRTTQLFDELVDLTPDLQQTRLAAIAAEDPAVADQVRRLIAAARVEHVDDEFAAAVEALLAGPRLEEGTRVGPYRVGPEIASGGMGTVYRAVHEETQREVAIKVLNRAWMSPLDRDRFVREYRVLASVDDEPRIARLYDVGTLEDGTAWFAMELVRGGVPITQYCVDRRVPLPRRLELFRDVCAAVVHAHSRAVVHRDLKPSNILVSENGEVRLLDFGIAGTLADLGEARDPDVEARSLTPAFAAPEQLTNDPVGTFTDLYVLGLLLYELLTGTRPFDLERRTAAEALEIVLTSAVKPPSSAAGLGVYPAERADWRDLDAICLRLLAVAPRDRYASAEGLLADVTRYLHDEPVHAHAKTPRLYVARKFLARRRQMVLAVAAAIVAVLALSAWSAVQLARERRETLSQFARTQRLQQFMLGLFSGAEPEVGPERELTVRRLLERGVLTAETLTHDPDIQAELTFTLGSLFRELGDFSRADGLLRRSLDEKRRLLPADDPRVIESQIALSMLRTEQMQLDDAEHLARTAMAATGRLPDSHVLKVRAGLALGRTLIARARYNDAIVHLEGVARHFAPDSTATVEESAVLTQLATAHQYVGHAEKADDLNRRVLELDRRVHGNRHPLVADDLLNLADAEATRGRYAQAEALAREALGILRGWYGSLHPETGSSARILANALINQGKTEEGTALLEEARTIFAAVYPGPHRRTGLVLNDLGTAAFRAGRYDDAIAAFSEALAIYRKVYADGKSQYISVGLANLGSAYLEKGDYARAEVMLREAVTLSRAVLSPTHPTTAIAEIKLGRTLVRQRRYQEAVPLLKQGSETLASRTDGSVSWLQRAREDLALALKHLDRES